jgi:proline dehydrogenase
MRRTARLRRTALVGLATSAAFERAVGLVPGARERAWKSARRYVAGAEIGDAVAVVAQLREVALAASVDLFGEHASAQEAPLVAAAFEELCGRLDEQTWVSLDLSHIAFDERALDRIAAAAAPRRLQLGAEEAETADRVQALALGAAARGRPVEVTLQANLRRSVADADRLADAGVPVRLVKGAYPESAADAHPWGSATDNAYAALALRLAAGGTDVALATHDPSLRKRVLAEIPQARCEMLLGVLPRDAVALAAAGTAVRIYVPFGPEWFRYFMRRRAESQGA